MTAPTRSTRSASPARRGLVAAALSALALAACGRAPGHGDGGARLIFGIPSTESSVQLAASWAPLLADLSAALGQEVKPFFATDYAGIIEAMRAGHVDLAWFGNKAALEAADRAGGEVFAQMVDGDGHAGYWSVLVVRDDSPLQSVEEVLTRAPELSIGIGDPNSTSGFLVPLVELFAPRGLDPKRAFARALQGNHESNALAVALGHIDVAPVDSKVLRRLADSHPDRYARLREVWRSELIPSDALCWRKALPEPLRTRLREWFTTYGAAEGPDAAHQRAVLAGLDLRGFRASDDTQLLPIRALEATKLRLQREHAGSPR
ncbi:MAG: phosphate/phosphite/phosphonate ABC transporter substrate-binding protein [Planctomycetota bacterium]